jgi:hypothetical protein
MPVATTRRPSTKSRRLRADEAAYRTYRKKQEKWIAETPPLPHILGATARAVVEIVAYLETAGPLPKKLELAAAALKAELEASARYSSHAERGPKTPAAAKRHRLRRFGFKV